MRTDVKVGIALGAIVLIVAGAYYGANKDPDIQLAGADDDVRAQNKRTLRDLLAPPPHTPTTSRNAARSASASPTPEPRTPARVDDTSASKLPSEPIAQTPRRRSDLPRRASGDSEDSPSTFLPKENADTSPTVPPSKTAPWIPKPIAGMAGHRDQPATSNGALTPAPPPASTKARRTSERNPKTAPRKTPKPIARTRIHMVAPEDNFSTLAERYYGSQSYAGFLLQANPNVDPRRMKIGSRITIPPLNFDDAGSPARSGSHEVGTRYYYVQEGDSLYAIADAKLGTGTRWNEIYELNKTAIGADPSRLKVGIALTLPAY